MVPLIPGRLIPHDEILRLFEQGAISYRNRLYVSQDVLDGWDPKDKKKYVMHPAAPKFTKDQEEERDQEYGCNTYLEKQFTWEWKDEQWFKALLQRYGVRCLTFQLVSLRTILS